MIRGQRLTTVVQPVVEAVKNLIRPLSRIYWCFDQWRAEEHFEHSEFRDPLFVADDTLCGHEYRQATSIIADWVHRGGTIISGGNFSARAKPDRMIRLFQRLNLPWAPAPIPADRPKVELNRDMRMVKHTGLSVKSTTPAVLLRNVEPPHSLYYCTEQTLLESATCMAEYGEGRVGYIGDIGFQSEEMKQVVLAFLRLSEINLRTAEEMEEDEN